MSRVNLLSSIYPVVGLTLVVTAASGQSNEQHDRELIGVSEIIREATISPDLRLAQPAPPRDEVFHAVTDIMSREQALTTLDSGDVDTGLLRNTAQGQRIVGILNDSSVETVQFVTMDPLSLAANDLGDAPMLGDTQTFLGVSVNNAKVRQFSGDRTQWIASLRDSDDQEGDAALIITEQGATGFIRKGAEVYEVTPIGDGLHTLTLRSTDLPERNSDDFEVPETVEPAESPQPQPIDDLDDSALIGVDEAAPDGTAQTTQCSVELSETVTIEVAAGYTQAAKEKALAGGKDIENLILSASVLGNTTFDNSDINVELEVVHMMLLPNYQEGTGSMTKESGDLVGAVPDLAPLLQARKDTKSDVVVLVVNRDDPGNCGRAVGINVSADKAMAVANWRCMNENFSYAHEIGHLAGAWHNPEVLSNTSPKNPPYAHGFAMTSDREFVTVMGYPTTCSPDRCPRVWNWSNPDATTFFGAPTGTNDTHNNACLWRERAPVVAAFGDQI